MLKVLITRVALTDLAHGNWCVSGNDVTWVDANSLTTGVVESNLAPIEDASWLCWVGESKHINLVALDVMLKGVNLVLQWKATVIHPLANRLSMHRSLGF